MKQILINQISTFSGLGAYLFPIFNSLYLSSTNSLPPAWVLAASVLVLHAKSLLFLRVIEFVERYFIIVLCVARHVFSFLLILILVTAAYADAFWMYLREAPSDSGNGQNQYKSYETSIVALHHVVMSR